MYPPTNTLDSSYRKLIHDHQADPCAYSFDNEGVDHALILMDEIFKFCEDKIRIFAKGLGGTLASNKVYKDSLLQYLDKGGKIDVLVENDSYATDNESALHLLLNRALENGDKIHCRVVNGIDTIKKINSHFISMERCNFLVGDGKVSRIEFNPANFKAVGNFHDVERASKLEKIFDKYFSLNYSHDLIIDVA